MEIRFKIISEKGNRGSKCSSTMLIIFFDMIWHSCLRAKKTLNVSLFFFFLFVWSFSFVILFCTLWYLDLYVERKGDGNRNSWRSFVCVYMCWGSTSAHISGQRSNTSCTFFPQKRKRFGPFHILKYLYNFNTAPTLTFSYMILETFDGYLHPI